MHVSFAPHRSLQQHEIEAFESVSGVRVWPRAISATANAAGIVRALCSAFDLPVTPRAAPPHPFPTGAKLALGVLREWVPEFLTPYQREGIAWILKEAPNGSGHLWWPTGSGKTLGAIVWACAWRARVITVTKAAVRGQYRAEIERLTTLRPVILDGERAEPISVEATWLVTSYEVLPAWIAEIEAWAKGLQLAPSLILDESHKVKSHKRWDVTVAADEKVTFDLADNVAAAAHRLSKIAGRRLATTRTPVRDRPRDLWAQLDLVHPGAWGPYLGPQGKRRGFAWRYCAASEGSFGGVNDRGCSNGPELAVRLDAVAHRIDDAVVKRDLPPCRRVVTYVPVAEQVRAVGIAKEFKAAQRHGANAVLELRLMEAAARKRKRLLDRVEEAAASKEKIVVFTGRRRDCEVLAEEIAARLKRAGIVAEVWSGHGGTPADERERMRVAYMAAKGPAVLVGTGDAWGEGLNLQDTDLALFAMLPYTPGQVIQWEGRFSRLGQTRAVLIEYLIAEGTVDEHVASILLGKLPALERIVQNDEVRGLGMKLLGLDDVNIHKKLAASVLSAETEEV